MKRLLLCSLVVATLLTAAPAGPPAVAADASGDATLAAQRATVRLDGVRVRLRAGTRQVVSVRHTHGYHARVTWWVRSDGRWAKRMQTADGRTGYGGLVRGTHRRQGTGTTPLGTYGLVSAFGTHRASRHWDLRYRRIRAGDYWVEDNASHYYNRYRNKARGGFRWWLPSSDANSSERLRDYPVQYEWALVTSFNRQQVRHRGAGIFLHVNGSGATAGCVSAPRWFIRKLLHRIHRDARPLIAIGR
jgi:L,D-peptidoglycan transpeptidase YkuD (ErfK/YbiS/YcfS/YnhG family)